MHETRPTPDDGVRIVQRLQLRTHVQRIGDFQNSRGAGANCPF